MQRITPSWPASTRSTSATSRCCGCGPARRSRSRPTTPAPATSRRPKTKRSPV